MGEPIHLLISIDVEPDEHLVDRDEPGPWRGFEDLLRRIGPIRRRLAEGTGRPVHFGWYWRLDPQIEGAYGRADWPLHTYTASIDELARAGDIFGIHTHAWRWSPARRTWFADHADEDWVSLCVQLSFDTFEGFFRAPCVVHRFGSSWINGAALDDVERLGAAYDLTVEAGHPPEPVDGWWQFNTGDIPDLRQVPTLPYRRDREDFRRPAADHGGRLWIVPVSGATIAEDGAGGAKAVAHIAGPDRRKWRRPRAHKMLVAAARHLPIGSQASLMTTAHDMLGRIGRSDGGRSAGPAFEALNLPFLPPPIFACAFEHALSVSRRRYVHTVVRAGDLAQPQMHANFLANMDYLRGHPLAHRFQVSTPDRLAASWAS